MHVGLGHAGTGDAHEFRLGAHLFDGCAAGVAHGRTQAAHQLVDDRGQGALVGNTAFDAFRYQLLGAGRGVLEVAVGRALRLCHGTQRAHAAVGLVGTALEQFDFTRSLFGTGEHRTHHHAGSTGNDGLGQVTREADAAVGDQRHASAFQCSGNVGDGADLRHADTGNDTGGADRARADTDLDRVSASFGQSLGGSAGGDVAADHLHLRVGFLDPANAVDHTFGVTVGGVDHHHVNASSHQGGNALAGVLAGADRGADAQATLVVLAGQRVGLGLFDVLDGHHALEVELVVNDQDFFQAVLVQQLTDFVLVGAFADGDQTLFRGHHVADLGVQAAFEAHVTGGDDADQVAVRQHRNAGDVVQAGQVEQVAHGGVGVDGDRVLDHASLELLDLADFAGLLFDGHVLVDDADAAFLGHGNGQARFGHGIHGSGNQRNVQLDAAGQTGLETDFIGQYLGIARYKEDIVEGQGFLADTQHRGGSRAGKMEARHYTHARRAAQCKIRAFGQPCGSFTCTTVTGWSSQSAKLSRKAWVNPASPQLLKMNPRLEKAHGCR